MTGQSKIIEVSIKDESGVKVKKYAQNQLNEDFFKNDGKIFEDRIEVTANGTYTIYSEDEAGNEATKTVTITGITQ